MFHVASILHEEVLACLESGRPLRGTFALAGGPERPLRLGHLECAFPQQDARRSQASAGVFVEHLFSILVVVLVQCRHWVGLPLGRRTA